MRGDPGRVRTRADLARELDLLRGVAARGTGRTRVALTELARRVAVPRSTVHTYLTGLALPPAEVVDRIVIALDATPAEQAAWADAWERVAVHEHESRRAVPTDPRPAPRQLPPDVPAFTGRVACLDALDRLLDDRRAGRTAVVSAIAGTPGVGKTALAVHWAHRVADRFPDGQLHLNLRGYDAHAPLTPAEAAAVLLRALGATDVPPTLEERASRLRSELADRRVLLLLDNAGSVEQVRHLLPATRSCFAVVTSRDSLAGLSVLDGAERLDLDVLSTAESVDLLRALLGERVRWESDAAADLVERCARLPLALRVAAELARATTLRDVVDGLADERTRLDLLDSSGDPRSMVRAVFSWSYRRLPADAATLFLLLGRHPGRDFDVPSAAALVGRPPAETARTLDLLVRANLVQDGGNHRYDRHDLLRDYGRELAEAATPDVVEPATARLLDHYLSTTAAAFGLAYPAHRQEDTGPPPHWLADADAARAWLTAEADNLVAVVELAAATGAGDVAARLAALAARHLDTTAQWPEALRMHRAALDAARGAGDVAAEATALRDMSIAAGELGERVQALEWLRRCAALRRELGDGPGTAAALSSIGVMLDALSRFDEATASYQEAIALNRELGDPHRAAMALLNLGVVLQRRGDVDGALANHREALEAFREAGDALGEAHALTNTGVALNLRGEPDRATPLLEEALTAYRALGSRLGEAFALKGLGSALAACGDHAAALPRYAEALEITAELSQPTLRTEVLNRLGRARCATGDHPGARDAHHDALALARERGDRLEEANALHGLGRVARATDRLDTARRHWLRALDLYDALGVADADRLRGELAALEP
ncbi:ATP-binding protein [Umezawaea sp.]|uniref:ATP-binding protein n=1 Tax=Umezawaea sp. TaxID=1955258 RepID=UPI002ED570BE